MQLSISKRLRRVSRGPKKDERDDYAIKLPALKNLPGRLTEEDIVNRANQREAASNAWLRNDLPGSHRAGSW